MSTAMLAYIVAAAFKIRFMYSNDQAVTEATDLWRKLMDKI